MAPVKACTICGATTDLVGYAGSWICAVEGPCLVRSAVRIWQPTCDVCGGLENVYLLRLGWQCDYCLSGDTLPDYEALGYPETGLVYANDLQGSAELADTFMWTVVNGAPIHRTRKDIPASTDIVDSAAKDSY